MAESRSRSELQSTRSVRVGGDERQEVFKVQPPEPRTLPESVGRFRPLSFLGTGGGGIVYLADDPLLHRQVAVKVPKVNGSLSDYPFLAEARAAARLKHPHVVQIFDVGTLIDGQMFIAMELVPGGSLAARLKRQPPLHWKEATRIVAQVASAIEVAHQHKLLHRDLKPSNVLLDEHANAKVADFGLSMSTDESLVVGGSITGTPAYMSPEQVSGESEHLTARSDIWSIGVVLYESLTGRRPFAADSWLALHQMILRDEPVAPRSVDPTIPRTVEAVCLQCLQKNPDDRPASAAQIADQLRNFLERRQRKAVRRSARAATALLVLGTSVAGWKWAGVGSPQRSVAAPIALSALAPVSPAPDAKTQWPETTPLQPFEGSLDLLTVRPEVWIFDRGSANSRLSIDPANRQLSMASPAGAVFSWPVRMPASFGWKSRFQYSSDGTQITLAWNVHPTMLSNGSAGYESNSVSVSRARGSTHLIANVGRAAWIGRAPSQVRDFESPSSQLAGVDLPAADAPIEVELIVQEHVLKTLRVNGVTVRHEHFRYPAFDPAPENVQPAIYVHGGQLSVIESEISPTAELR